MKHIIEEISPKLSLDTTAIINALGVEIATIGLQLEIAAQFLRGEEENLDKAAFRFFELMEFMRNYGRGTKPPTRMI